MIATSTRDPDGQARRRLGRFLRLWDRGPQLLHHPDPRGGVLLYEDIGAMLDAYDRQAALVAKARTEGWECGYRDGIRHGLVGSSEVQP